MFFGPEFPTSRGSGNAPNFGFRSFLEAFSGLQCVKLLFRLWFVVFYVGFIVFWSSKFPSCRVLRGFYAFLFGSGQFLFDFHMGFHTPMFPASCVLRKFLVGSSSIVVFLRRFGNVLDSNA